MLAANRQLAVAVIQQPPAQQPDIDPKILAPQPALDRDLPQAGRAEQQLVFRRLDQGARLRRQAAGTSGRPQQQMGVQQQLHVPPPNSRSISASPIRSKSSGTAICPAMKPNRRRCPASGALNAMTLTSGLPALAITNGSPWAACSTSREQLRLRLVDVDGLHRGLR